MGRKKTEAGDGEGRKGVGGDEATTEPALYTVCARFAFHGPPTAHASWGRPRDLSRADPIPDLPRHKNAYTGTANIYMCMQLVQFQRKTCAACPGPVIG